MHVRPLPAAKDTRRPYQVNQTFGRSGPVELRSQAMHPRRCRSGSSPDGNEPDQARRRTQQGRRRRCVTGGVHQICFARWRQGERWVEVVCRGQGCPSSWSQATVSPRLNGRHAGEGGPEGDRDAYGLDDRRPQVTDGEALLRAAGFNTGTYLPCLGTTGPVRVAMLAWTRLSTASGIRTSHTSEGPDGVIPLSLAGKRRTCSRAMRVLTSAP